MKIAIIDYGAGNIKSIQFALQRLGYKGILTSDVKEIKLADKVIFPGVGEASSAMQKLRDSGLDNLIPTLTQPVLGICLGMQLLCNGTEEGTTKGIGIFNIDVIKFSSQVKVPQIGWNTISNLKTGLFSEISENEFMYTVNSFFAPLCDNTIAETDYNGNYSAALKKDNFYGVQFHPEKSGNSGEKILENFLKL
ncbi:imidazole glycerol phosphate synthase subunit HisH [Patiriisocius marinistellae]|uniref:Imidazole glycerol phosphate synthase subunit HisH n=1 Tax=Patiriisocius marinistellae TaxID=2494560 RepID=A0A5J4FWH0_9FLAO|nr:imidazole glycerol phosphate synthase subunit HisH [Patiriisocius marinistellae]GEQ86333.1 imidazole glycerol phosphate synthase subunit HisH [Patiriisocius marinistellae]